MGVEAEGTGPLLAAAVARCCCCGWAAAADGLGSVKEKLPALPGAAGGPDAIKDCAGASLVSPVKLGTRGGPAVHKLLQMTNADMTCRLLLSIWPKVGSQAQKVMNASC